MNLVLALLVLAALGGAFYEHTTLQEQTDYDQQQIQDAQTKLNAFEANATKLESGDADATQALTDLQSKITQVTGDVTPLADEISQLKLLSFTPPPPPKVVVVPTDPNDLGTISTLTGQTYPKAHLLKLEDDGITISYDGGITKVLFGVLTLELQKKFGYNAHVEASKTDLQLQEAGGTPTNKSVTTPTPAPDSSPVTPIRPLVPTYPPTSPTGN